MTHLRRMILTLLVMAVAVENASATERIQPPRSTVRIDLEARLCDTLGLDGTDPCRPLPDILISVRTTDGRIVNSCTTAAYAPGEVGHCQVQVPVYTQLSATIFPDEVPPGYSYIPRHTEFFSPPSTDKVLTQPPVIEFWSEQSLHYDALNVRDAYPLFVKLRICDREDRQDPCGPAIARAVTARSRDGSWEGSCIATNRGGLLSSCMIEVPFGSSLTVTSPQPGPDGYRLLTYYTQVETPDIPILSPYTPRLEWWDPALIDRASMEGRDGLPAFMSADEAAPTPAVVTRAAWPTTATALTPPPEPASADRGRPAGRDGVETIRSVLLGLGIVAVLGGVFVIIQRGVGSPTRTQQLAQTRRRRKP